MDEKPVHEQEMRDLLKAIPKRIVGLVSKVISVKVVIFVMGTILLVAGVITEWVWLTLASIVIFGREILKYLPSITGRK
jgi:hypothetical protein